MGTLRCALLIAGKDLRLEARTRDLLGSAGLFAVTVLVTVSFVLPASGPGRQDAAAGLLWISLVFAVLLAVGRSAALEQEESSLEGLLLSPAPRESLFLGKLLANLAVVAAIEVPLVAVFLVLLGVRPAGPPGALAGLVAVLLLATLGLVTVATLFAVIAVGSRVGPAALPLLVLPVVLPLLIAAVEASRQALAGDAQGGAGGRWLALLSGFDLLVLAAGAATFPYLVEE